MTQKNTLGYFQKSSLRTPELERLNIFIGKWINEGYRIGFKGERKLPALAVEMNFPFA